MHRLALYIRSALFLRSPFMSAPPRTSDALPNCMPRSALMLHFVLLIQKHLRLYSP